MISLTGTFIAPVTNQTVFLSTGERKPPRPGGGGEGGGSSERGYFELAEWVAIDSGAVARFRKRIAKQVFAVLPQDPPAA